MSTTAAYRWEGAGTPLPSGHRIYETHDHPEGSRWAIADESGKYPDQTNDGVLWLDFERSLDASTRHAPTVPLRDDEGNPSSTPVDAPTIFYLARMFRWTVQDEIRGRFYSVS
jgi:hypothetical protein